MTRSEILRLPAKQPKGCHYGVMKMVVKKYRPKQERQLTITNPFT